MIEEIIRIEGDARRIKSLVVTMVQVESQDFPQGLMLSGKGLAKLENGGEIVYLIFIHTPVMHLFS